MLNYNGTLCESVEQLQALMNADGLSEQQQQFLINDFNGVPNQVVAALKDVTPRQIRQAMVLSGISMASIDAAIDALPEPTKSLARIEWEYSTLFIRSNPLVGQIGMALNKTPAELDTLWALAATL